jgi:hypothetical protein
MGGILPDNYNPAFFCWAIVIRKILNSSCEPLYFEQPHRIAAPVKKDV